MQGLDKKRGPRILRTHGPIPNPSAGRIRIFFFLVVFDEVHRSKLITVSYNTRLYPSHLGDISARLELGKATNRKRQNVIAFREEFTRR